jgi:hypothetical protein
MLPAKVEKLRKWIAGPGGEVTKWEPPAPVRTKPLTTGQQHAAMRVALAHALRLLTEHGFRTNCLEQSTCAISLSYKGMDFDISIREPKRIAYITSVVGDRRNRQKIGEDINGNAMYNVGPGVKLASDEMRSTYVVQVIGSKISTLMPVYIDLPPNEAKPIEYILKNVLLLISNIMKDQKLIDAANMDTATMTKGKLPDWLTQEMGDAFLMLDDMPESGPTRMKRVSS